MLKQILFSAGGGLRVGGGGGRGAVAGGVGLLIPTRL